MNDIEMRFDDNIIIGGAGEVQEKTVTPDAAGQIVRPDTGYDALSKVIVNGDADLVPENVKDGVNIFGVTGNYDNRKPEQEKTVSPTPQGSEILPDSGKVLSKVTLLGDEDLVAENVKKDVEIFGVVGTYDNRLPEQVKTATPTAAGVEVLPDEGKTLSRVNIPAEPNLVPGKIKAGENIFGVVGEYETPTEEKSVTPGTQAIEVTPDTGKHLSKVTVAGDADLVANNIRDGVDIFGVTGNLLERKEEQVKNVTPDAAGFEVTPDSGKALSKVVVAGDTNLVASNIKKDVNVFGVTGTYEGTETNFVSFIENDTGMIVLPEGLTSIRQSCFKADSHQFTLPESLEAIGSYAFSGCTGMTSLSIPDNVTMIDTYAFNGCKNIEGSITIPAGVNDIAGSSWYGCNKITEFIIKAPFTAARYNRIQAYAFYNCSACLRYDFTAAEAVPELANINAFNNHNADLRIIVPDALYNDWIAATNWSNSNISEHIVKASEA